MRRPHRLKTAKSSESGPGAGEKPFDLAARQIVRLEKVSPEFLVQISEEVLYELRP